MSRSREQLPCGVHLMAVDSVRVPRTDLGMDTGGGRQKLLEIPPGETQRGEGHGKATCGPAGPRSLGGPLTVLPSAIRGSPVGGGPTPEPRLYCLLGIRQRARGRPERGSCGPTGPLCPASTLHHSLQRGAAKKPY